jgi:GTP-binding protein
VTLDPPLPEFAFIGRSNVGKSSLINALLRRKRLARVSSTPGKTTLINVYRLPTFYLVDLPGYGFAKASKTARAGYRKLITAYLKDRPDVAGLVWLLDIRHAPSAEDRWMLDLLHAQGHATLIVLTKADKISRQERPRRLSTLAEDLQADVDQVQLVSVKSGEGIADLGASLIAALPEGDS